MSENQKKQLYILMGITVAILAWFFWPEKSDDEKIIRLMNDTVSAVNESDFIEFKSYFSDDFAGEGGLNTMIVDLGVRGWMGMNGQRKQQKKKPVKVYISISGLEIKTPEEKPKAASLLLDVRAPDPDSKKNDTLEILRSLYRHIRIDFTEIEGDWKISGAALISPDGKVLTVPGLGL